MSKLLTISVAAYNVEKYLEQTLSSLFDNRFIDDIEVLIIDDGSKDNTKEIALKYHDMAPGTFKYVPKENGGHGSTINKGIELASGKYFRVIDGDDWVDTDNFYEYIQKLKSADVDMVLTKHIKVCEDSREPVNIIKQMEDGKVYSWSDGIDMELVTLHMLTVKTALLQNNNIHITEKCFYVDIEYIIWSIFLSGSFVYWDLPVYMYRVGNAAQSINKRNMLKNVEMQKTVSLNLAVLYEQFKASGKLTSNKEAVIFRRIAGSIGATVRTYLLLDNAAEAKDKIEVFERSLKEISPYIFDRLNKKLFFKAVRLADYSLIPIVMILYRFWCKRYE